MVVSIPLLLALAPISASRPEQEAIGRHAPAKPDSELAPVVTPSPPASAENPSRPVQIDPAQFEPTPENPYRYVQHGAMVPSPTFLPAPPRNLAISKQPRLTDFYPPDLRKAHVKGVSSLLLSVDPQGAVVDCRRRMPADAGKFDGAACALARSITFVPTGLAKAGPLPLRIVWRGASVDLIRAAPSVFPTAIMDSLAISQKDYPAAAIRAGEQGKTVAMVQVSAAGSATGCEIFSTSGWLDLDQATCRVLSRMHYNPGTDEYGTPVDRGAIIPITWRLPT